MDRLVSRRLTVVAERGLDREIYCWMHMICTCDGMMEDGCGAEYVLIDLDAIRDWFCNAKHGWRTVCSGWLVGDQAVSLCLLGSCGDGWLSD
ncbi:hypothetical protein F2Q69_00011164 [Brassica cretica]|uniref:Uncharacterized protein n=1 Tax=Brassica cretica TaxID=69181 RepID=A0A8S9QV59_BRACR|nr:hypothetical protein F2Q69_00011164 [Brassica cretica]